MRSSTIIRNKVLAISCLNQISSQHHSFPGQRRQYGTKLRLQREQQRSEIASQLLSKCNAERRVSNGFDLHASKAQIHTGSKSAPEPSKKIGNVADVSIRSVMASAAGAAALGGHLAGKVIDPFRLMEPQLRSLTENLKTLASADNKVLDTVSRYFFDVPGKRFRPALVLLVAQASPPTGEISSEQQRLAEITEMIHTASLLHDDVMDHAEIRRGVPSLNTVHGNKLAILAGDFLLSRASLNLARLKNVEVIELLSTVIAHLVEGEIMQSRTETSEATNFDYYMRKTYLKTASLLAHSCKGVVLLGKADEGVKESASEVAFEYGKHLGLAFQIQDDVLDFEGDLQSLGKTPGSDLREGLTTAPVLFALEKYSQELEPMIHRCYKGEGDVERTMQLVKMSEGVARSRELALEHSRLAIESANKFEPSVTRDALVQLAHLRQVVDRKA